jgi:hypothetical protein
MRKKPQRSPIPASGTRRRPVCGGLGSHAQQRHRAGISMTGELLDVVGKLDRVRATPGEDGCGALMRQ